MHFLLIVRKMQGTISPGSHKWIAFALPTALTRVEDASTGSLAITMDAWQEVCQEIFSINTSDGRLKCSVHRA